MAATEAGVVVADAVVTAVIEATAADAADTVATASLAASQKERSDISAGGFAIEWAAERGYRLICVVIFSRHF